MNKLKSLFRRGQGGSGNGGPSSSTLATATLGKQHAKKSQSSTSLNTLAVAGKDEEQLQQQHCPSNHSKYYARIDLKSEERGVDVEGFDSPSVNINALPNSRKNSTGKKGQKHTKSLAPTTPADEAFLSNRKKATTHHKSSAGDQTGHVENNTNNNYSLHAHASTTKVMVVDQQLTPYEESQENIVNSKMNPPLAIGTYQFISNDQERHQNLLEKSLQAENKMQSQVEYLEQEKVILESRIAELQRFEDDVKVLTNEIQRLQSLYEKSQMEVSNLKYENESLRNRLRDVVNSPLSDAEKHQIIQDSQRLHSSAPASIALPNVSNAQCSPSEVEGPGGTSGTATLGCCLTPDWDKQSSSSEISVACLQDKIIQMEETHYSTNEELQATLQELTDLQSQLGDAQAENERLSEEKDVLFQSLCRQTEKLNETRVQLTALQELLLRDAKQAEVGTSERENKLLEMIKTSQAEREATLLKQEELNSEVHELRQSMEQTSQENARLRERIALLESTVDAANAESRQIEAQLLQAKEEISHRSIEINRLSTLLDNARSKIEELEQDLARGEKTDLSQLLDAARKEKDTLEERVAEMQDQCSRNQAEIRRLKEQISILTEECKVAKNNGKCAVSDLEYRLEQMQQEKDALSGSYQQLIESASELQIQCKCHLEDKTQLQNLLSETQKHLGDVEHKLNETQAQLENETKMRKQEAEEWQQFQSDLLMTVRVANDFKAEALTEREQLLLDNKTQKEKIRLLEQQIEKLTKQQMQQNETQQSVLSTVQQEMASRRNKIGNFNRQDSRLSVKTLIESIENNKQPKTEEGSELQSTISSPTSGDNSIEAATGVPNILQIGSPAGSQNSNSSSNFNLINSTLGNAKAQQPQLQQQQDGQQQQQKQSGGNNANNGSGHMKPLSVGERKDPLNMLAKNGGSKRNALLKWCQNKTVGYRNIDITNFSSSWNDGLAFCAILHSYLPDRIPYDQLTPADKRRNFSLAFSAAESVGIPTSLNINDMCQMERPDWTQVMSYVTAIYKHFETTISTPLN